MQSSRGALAERGVAGVAPKGLSDTNQFISHFTFYILVTALSRTPFVASDESTYMPGSLRGEKLRAPDQSPTLANGLPQSVKAAKASTSGMGQPSPKKKAVPAGPPCDKDTLVRLVKAASEAAEGDQVRARDNSGCVELGMRGLF